MDHAVEKVALEERPNGDNERLKIKLGFTFGFSVLACVFALAYIIAVKKVDEHTSYGLEVVLNTLAVLAGGFVGWAFGHGPVTATERKKQEPPAI